MEIDPGEVATERIPDPAALAQGHRLQRLASSLELPTLLCGLAVLGVAGMTTLMRGRGVEAVLCGLVFVGAVWLVWARRQAPRGSASSRGSAPSRDSRLPAKVRDLLTVVDGLIDALERGDDRRFNIDSLDLMLALDGLGPDASYIDERGGDRARLRHGVACFDFDAKPSARISADRRRALQLELSRFAAAARGRPCGDPYRSGVGVGPALLAVMREPALAKTRRRYAGLLIVVVGVWGMVSQGLALVRNSGRWHGWAGTRRGLHFDGHLCNPWGNPNCGLIPNRLVEWFAPLPEWFARLPEWFEGLPEWFAGLRVRELDYAAVEPAVAMAIALVPMVLLVAASLSREVGRRSWAIALPAMSPWPGDPQGSGLGWARRRERLESGCWRALVWFVGLFGVGVLFGAHDWSWRQSKLAQRMLIVVLITLGVALVSMAVAEFERRRDRRRSQRRSQRGPIRGAVIAELSSLRREFEASEPAPAELLEQLADVLAEAPALGALATADRDCVVERLRLGAGRGCALAHDQRSRLVLDLRACEGLIGSRR